MKLPTFFISHGGGPCFFIDWTPFGDPHTWDGMAQSLRDLPKLVGSRPKAILVISGHWEKFQFTVTTNPHPPLLYDYSGFPPEAYKIEYPAPGSPELASKVRDLLGKAGFETAEDTNRGFDHGVFIPFKLIYPEADIPIVQLSLRHDLDPSAHIAAGRALAPLREEGILIVGSGSSYHDLRRFGPSGANNSEIFDTWLTEAVTKHDPGERNKALTNWESAPAARDAHPREEHLLPLMMVAGAAGEDTGTRIYSERVMGVRMSAFEFGEGSSL